MADYDMNYSSQSAAGVSADVNEGLRKYMLGIYNYLASGLLFSGIVGIAAFRLLPMDTLMGLKMIFAVATIGIILAMIFAGPKLSTGVVKGMYWVFSASFGLSLALYLNMFTPESILRTFLVTAGAFGGLSLYGYTTKKDLSGLGSFAVMGLFGLIIAAIVNAIWPMGGMFGFIFSLAGVAIFSIMIAWDTQSLKQQYFAARSQGELERSAVWGAFHLYLDFINLFQFLLHFLGQED